MEKLFGDKDLIQPDAFLGQEVRRWIFKLKPYFGESSRKICGKWIEEFEKSTENKISDKNLISRVMLAIKNDCFLRDALICEIGCYRITSLGVPIDIEPTGDSPKWTLGEVERVSKLSEGLEHFKSLRKTILDNIENFCTKFSIIGIDEAIGQIDKEFGVALDEAERRLKVLTKGGLDLFQGDIYEVVSYHSRVPQMSNRPLIHLVFNIIELFKNCEASLSEKDSLHIIGYLLKILTGSRVADESLGKRLSRSKSDLEVPFSAKYGRIISRIKVPDYDGTSLNNIRKLFK